MFPYLIIPIIMELFGVQKLHFSVTDKGKRCGGPKEKGGETGKRLRKAWPHLTLAVLSVMGLVLSLSETFHYKTLGNVVILYWLSYNLYMLIMAVFFMLGRQNFRGADRHFISERVEIRLPGRTVYGRTVDMSETGLGVQFYYPEYLPEEEVVVHVETERYAADVPARMLYSSKAGDHWKYAFLIGEMEERERQMYHQILYDREPRFPQVTAKNLSLFDDLAINVHRRLSDSRADRRRLPRIDVRQPMRLAGGRGVIVEDFNYEYVRLAAEDGGALPDRLELPLGDGVSIVCLREREKTVQSAAVGKGVGRRRASDRGFSGRRWLYRIGRPEDFAYTDQFREQVREWIRQGAEREKKEAALRRERAAFPEDEFFEMKHLSRDSG